MTSFNVDPEKTRDGKLYLIALLVYIPNYQGYV